MAHICTENIPCKECSHYRYDDDRNRMACFAEEDSKKGRKNYDDIQRDAGNCLDPTGT